MKMAAVRRFALALDGVSEQPHHHYASFRVHGRIFLTVPPEEDAIHVFVGEQDRECALAMYPQWTQKLLWGGKVAGLRVLLDGAAPAALKSLVRKAWEAKSR